VWFSIVSTTVFDNNQCSAKNGTFGTVHMLLNQEVDVIFGPVCSTGRPQVYTWNVIDEL